MAWIVLVASGCMECVWAVALGKSEGFSHPIPTIIFIVACLLSMLGLSYALKTLPVGTSYAVWVGVGAALTMAYGMVEGSESISVVNILLITGLIGCLVGLKLVSDA